MPVQPATGFSEEQTEDAFFFPLSLYLYLLFFLLYIIFESSFSFLGSLRSMCMNIFSTNTWTTFHHLVREECLSRN